MNELNKKLLVAAYEADVLADGDAMNELVSDIISGVQYFTADDIIGLLVQHIHIPEEAK